MELPRHLGPYTLTAHLGSGGMGDVYRHGVEVARRHLQGQPDDTRAGYLGAGALVALGRIEEGLIWADRARSIDPTDPMLHFNLAGIYAGVGRIEEALDMAEQAVRHGFSFKPGFENDPDLEPIRNHPRFQALLASLD